MKFFACKRTNESDNKWLDYLEAEGKRVLGLELTMVDLVNYVRIIGCSTCDEGRMLQHKPEIMRDFDYDLGESYGTKAIETCRALARVKNDSAKQAQSFISTDFNNQLGKGNDARAMMPRQC